MIIGIDLGTSNSLVAVWRDGRHAIVPNALGQLLTPSCVSLMEDGSVVVGQAARDRLLSHPGRSAATFKRFMGTERVVLLGGRAFRAEELSALVLRQLKADAEVYLAEAVEEAIVTVPAYFNDTQRKATKAAGEIAGLRVELLLNEPTAAALAYGLERLRADAQDSRILVVDLGGGTFDVSVLELFEGVMEVRAAAGDNFLGGEDWVDVIVDAFLEEIGLAAGMAARDAVGGGGGNGPVQPGYQALRRQAELAKRALSDQDQAVLEVSHEGAVLRWELSQARFLELTEPLLLRMRQPLLRVMKDSRLNPEDIGQVVLAGGATRMPAVRRMIARLFGRLPEQSINPDEVVARGAAVQAGLKMRDAALEEVAMTDVCPFTLGIEISRETSDGSRQSGLFSPILERNVVIPASRVQRYSTTEDGQRRIEIEVFQGEARMVRDNIRLGQLDVPVPRGKRGEQSLDVRFTYDNSGILEVEVVVVSTGAVHQLVIEGNPGVLTAEQIAGRRGAMAALKVHPREQAENVAALARAGRAYEESLGRMRTNIGNAIAEMLSALDRQEPGGIARERATLLRLVAVADRDPLG